MIKTADLDTPGVNMRGGYAHTAPAPQDLADEATLQAVATEFVSSQWMGATLPDDVAGDGLEKQLCKSRARSVLFRQPPMPPRIGRFTLIKRIGAGGMGEVFLAYDEQLGRSVAIKLVRPEYSRKMGANQRLLREARSLACLSHQNVVHVYDVGIHDGRVFIAMELIRGLTLRVWLAPKLGGASTGNRPWREILDTYLAAGRGLAAAHAEGLIHRDFKPENVLIGANGRVCVVDFGLAGNAYHPGVGASDTRGHATDRGSTPSGGEVLGLEQTMSERQRLTAAGAIMGTPAYMSPEQMAGEPTDARSDQFSFAVALYEALTGVHPFGDDATRESRQRRMLAGEVAAPQEKRVPARVLKVLRRALSPEPDARFASMDALLEALSRTTGSRGRNWFGVLAVAILAAAFLLAGRASERPAPCATAGATLAQAWNDEVITELRGAFLATGLPYAGDTFDRIKARLDTYVERLSVAQVEVCEATYVRRELPEKLFVVRSLCLEHRERYVQSLVSSLRSAEPQAVERSVEALAALPDVAACQNSENLVLGVRPPAPEIAGDVADVRSLLSEADVQHRLGNFERSLQMARHALKRAEGLKYDPLLAEALYAVGGFELDHGTDVSFEHAEQQMFAALDLAESLRHDELAAKIWTNLLQVALEREMDAKTAHRWGRRALAANQRIMNDRGRASVLARIGRIFYVQGDLVQAESYQRRALALARKSGLPGVDTGKQMHDLANVLTGLGRVAEASQMFAEARRLLAQELGEGHPDVARLTHDLATFLQSNGQFDQARALYEQAIAEWSKQFGPMHILVGAGHLALATLETSVGGIQRAYEHALIADQILTRVAEKDHTMRAQVQSVLGDIHFAQGRLDDALVAYGKALDIHRQRGAGASLFDALVHTNMSRALCAAGRLDEALAEADIADRLMKERDPGVPALRALPPLRRGIALLGKNAHDQAVVELEQALNLVDGQSSFPEIEVEVRWNLARALTEARGTLTERARTLVDQAETLSAQLGASGQKIQEEIRSWLVTRSPKPDRIAH